MFRKLLMAIVILLIPCLAFGAGITGSSVKYGTTVMVVTYEITFDGSGVISNTKLNEIAKGPGGATLENVAGWWLFKIESIYTGTVVTSDSDLYLWSYGSDVIDILGGNGVNKVDNNTHLGIYPATATQILTGTEIIDIDNNSVANSNHILRFILYR